ncbi:MAG: hypothetical protein Q8L48_13700 [Archangium sp.]|nr:hypothetical protein [Archangium sp.]
MAARKPAQARKSPALAFAVKLGMKPPPAVVHFSLSFRAPRQGRYQPPDYELVIDSTRASWCTYRNYNAAPRPIEPESVMVPVEMTSFVLLSASKGVDRAKVAAWARSLLTHAD